MTDKNALGGNAGCNEQDENMRGSGGNRTKSRVEDAIYMETRRVIDTAIMPFGLVPLSREVV